MSRAVRISIKAIKSGRVANCSFAVYMLRVALLTFLHFTFTQFSIAQSVNNLTGLPAYPNLNQASMDAVARTDALGHWCIRFVGATSDSVDVVEAWYRKALVNVSETDLTNDERYKYDKLSGIKMAVGINYVTVYRLAAQPPTTIELFRCTSS